MRHAKHSHQLGVKKEHRQAMLSSMAEALIKHERIKTTKAKAKALRPFVEPIITLAKKAALTDDPAKKLHFRRLAYSRMNNRKEAVNLLFEDKADYFTSRPGGYTRIYKLMPRVGDGAEMALIDLVQPDDEGYGKQRKSRNKKKKAGTTTAKAAASSANDVSQQPDEGAGETNLSPGDEDSKETTDSTEQEAPTTDVKSTTAEDDSAAQDQEKS